MSTPSSSRIRPALALSSPATSRSRVDFPHPEAPTITSISPDAKVMSIAFNTEVSPKLLARPCSSRMAIYLSVSVSPRTKAPCNASTTTTTGGSNANVVVAITRFQGVIWSGAIICTIPSTTVV